MFPKENRPAAYGPASTEHHRNQSNCGTPRCTRCKRPLYAVVSVARGCGWICHRHLRAESVEAA